MRRYEYDGEKSMAPETVSIDETLLRAACAGIL